MLIGYARVSLRLKQDPAAQVAALKAAGCARVFVDELSRYQDERPGLAQALDHLRPGDTLVVWKLDRVAAGMRQAARLLDELHGRGANLRSLTEAFDTSTPVGEVLFGVLAVFARLETEANHERTRERLAYLKSKGVRLGRKPLLTQKQVQQAEQLLRDPDNTIADVAALLGVSRATLNRARSKYRAGPQ